MNLKPFSVLRLAWSDVAQSVASIIPPLTHAEHKGNMGRIGILGGSRDYTGAPYYAASSALKIGADLSYVFCSEGAATPIKCYSPELMVTPLFNDANLQSSRYGDEVYKSVELIDTFLSRLHSLVVGPGLGRGEGVVDLVAGTISRARIKGVNIVIDADGLWCVAQRPSIVQGCENCVLTPNIVEFNRLVETVQSYVIPLQLNNSQALLEELRSDSIFSRVRAVSQVLGVTIVLKGAEDILTSGGDVIVLERPRGSPRRCGGQGDLLAGCLGVTVHWAKRIRAESSCSPPCPSQDQPTEAPPSSMLCGLTPTILAGVLATATVKTASELAFAEAGRSMTSVDVLAKLGQAFRLLHPESA